MTDRRVVITGTGIVTAMGDSRQQIHQALCRGESGLARPAGFDDMSEGVNLVGEMSNFRPEKYLGERNLRPLNRTAHLLTAATQLALDDSRWTAEMSAAIDVGLVAGTTFCSIHTISQFDCRAQREGPGYASPLDFANTVINSAAGQTAIWHNLRGVNSTISAGTASGLAAVAYAIDMIRDGQQQAMIAGGVEELSSEALLGFWKTGLLCCADGSHGTCPIPFDARRNGFALSEAAAVLMLEDLESAQSRGATILAEFKGHGNQFCLDTGRQSDLVNSIAQTIEMALDQAGLPAKSIQALDASANGSVEIDRAEALGIKAVFNGSTSAIHITASKSAIGETMGASGGIQIALMIQSMADGRLPGICGYEQSDASLPLPNLSNKEHSLRINNCLVNSVGLDGHCRAMVLGRM